MEPRSERVETSEIDHQGKEDETGERAPQQSEQPLTEAKPRKKKFHCWPVTEATQPVKPSDEELRTDKWT